MKALGDGLDENRIHGTGPFVNIRNNLGGSAKERSLMNDGEEDEEGDSYSILILINFFFSFLEISFYHQSTIE